MLTEEIGLNHALAAAGIDAVETDLGEYIVQAARRPPLPPARAGGAPQRGPDRRAVRARVGPRLRPRRHPGAGRLRRERSCASASSRPRSGSPGSTCAVAESGTLVLVESEGNIRLCTALPRVHVAVMGIEKVVRDWAGAAHLMQLLPLAAHGVPAPASLSLITGPARDGDDGPEALHLVLVDDGRCALRGTEYESALHCIRCGACLYACPVYRQIGGHAYGSTLQRPDRRRADAGARARRARQRRTALAVLAVRRLHRRVPGEDPARRAARHAAGRRRSAATRIGPRRRCSPPGARLWSRPGGYRATAATAGRALGPLWGKLARAARATAGTRARLSRFSRWTDGRDVRAPDPEPFHARWRQRRG